LRPGFFEARRDLYNLYPLLVHVRLFGGAYVSQVDATLRRFGF
jgi:fructosamine-3-kinase